MVVVSMYMFSAISEKILSAYEFIISMSIKPVCHDEVTTTGVVDVYDSCSRVILILI